LDTKPVFKISNDFLIKGDIKMNQLACAIGNFINGVFSITSSCLQTGWSIIIIIIDAFLIVAAAVGFKKGLTFLLVKDKKNK
jgi:hypothetical protein